MSGSKQSATKPPKKAALKRAAAPKPAAKPFKSAEFVEDSEDEEGASAVSGRNTSPTRPQKRQSPPGEAKHPAKPKLAPAAAKPSKKQKSPTPSASETESSGAESDSAKRSHTPKELKSNAIPSKLTKDVVPPQVASVTLKRRKSLSHTSSETEYSDSTSQEETSPKPTSVTQKPSKGSFSQKQELPKPAAPVKRKLDQGKNLSPESTEDETSESTSRDGSGNKTGSKSRSDENSSREDTDQRTFIAKPRPQQQQAAVQSPLLPFTPPSGFEATSISSRSKSMQAELFSPSSLQGKQIWQITVPAGVSISSITEVAKQSVQDGSAVLSYKGADYGLIAEADSIDIRETLLLPSAEDGKYEPSSHGITKTLHLQQLVRPPDASRGLGSLSNATASIYRPRHQKPVPQQPEGLRMRYKPFGDPDSDTSHSDSTSKQPQPAPQFRVPKGVERLSPPKKRKRDEPEAEVRNGSESPKKSRREITSSASTISGKDSSPIESNRKEHRIPHADKKSKKSRKDVALPAPMVNGKDSFPLKETPIQQRSPSKDEESKRKRHENGKPTPSTKSNHDKDSNVLEESPVKSQPSVPQNRASAPPTANGKAPSPVKETPNDIQSRPKKKSRKKHHGDVGAASIAQSSQDKLLAAVDEDLVREPVPPGARSDYEKHATAGAQSAEKETPLDIAQETKMEEAKASTGKKSKRREETAEEKAKRRAERKKRKELKSNGVVDG